MLNQNDVELVYEVHGSHGNRLVVIEPQALSLMREFRQIKLGSSEAGGVLIGERRGRALIVKEVTTPSAKDSSSRFRFVRKFYNHQFAIIKANRSSGGRSNYLGEWHTHPQDRPYPSSTDFKNWESSLSGKESYLVSVVGREGEWWALYESGKFHNLILLSS